MFSSRVELYYHIGNVTNMLSSQTYFTGILLILRIARFYLNCASLHFQFRGVLLDHVLSYAFFFIDIFFLSGVDEGSFKLN